MGCSKDDDKPEGGNPHTPPPPPAASAEQIASWLRLFVEPGQVVELRALKVKGKWGRPQTVAGFFDADHLPQMAEEALRLEKNAQGVYFTLNPLNPDILARRCNRVDVAEQGDSASDSDVQAGRWLLVDADPVRTAKTSSTAEEKQLALDAVVAVHGHLRERGWPVPILADSGNGYHLLYRIDLPAEDGGVVERVLKALAARFDTDAVTIDQTVFNPARITKLYGTVTRKGDSTPERPHRRSQIVEVP